jgi:hypothetical protein
MVMKRIFYLFKYAFKFTVVHVVIYLKLMV